MTDPIFLVLSQVDVQRLARRRIVLFLRNRNASAFFYFGRSLEDIVFFAYNVFRQ
jgi:hypothetical protein